MGSNMAEAHPVGFRFVMRARENGARVIHVDPHYSRTSACATDYVPIRTGTDIVFLGGIINQVLLQDRWFKEYVLAYTNAATIITEGYQDAEDNAGIFSGFDSKKKAYDMVKANWGYADQPNEVASNPKSKTRPRAKRSVQNPISLDHPNCVLNILRRHYARYTP